MRQRQPNGSADSCLARRAMDVMAAMPALCLHSLFAAYAASSSALTDKRQRAAAIKFLAVDDHAGAIGAMEGEDKQ